MKLNIMLASASFSPLVARRRWLSKLTVSRVRPARPLPSTANNFRRLHRNFGGVIKEKASELTPWWPRASCRRRARPTCYHDDG